VIAIPWLYGLIGLAAGILLGSLTVVLFYRLGFSKARKGMKEAMENADLEAQKALGEAQKTGENRKRELLLQAKEEIHKARLELEKELKEKKTELARERSRLDLKEETLDKKLETLDAKEEALDQRVSDVLALEERAKELEKAKVLELERVSEMTLEEARTLVLDQARREFSHDMAVMLKQMEEATREEADRKAKEIVVNSISVMRLTMYPRRLFRSCHCRTMR
jgi:ribonuclease Y